MIVRPGQAGDIRAMAAILAANKEPIDWPDQPDLGWPYLDHLVARARTNVAEVGGEVVGFGGSVAVGRDAVRFLTDLFVVPSSHGRGAGRSLLAPLLDGSVERMTFSSGNQRALGLYIRAGMRPWWPLLYLEIPAGALEASDPGVVARPTDVEETARWSSAWTGVHRSVDFAHYASLPEASGYVIEDGGAVVAVGWARRERKRTDGRWLDHASLAPDAEPVRIGLAVLRAAAGTSACWRPCRDRTRWLHPSWNEGCGFAAATSSAQPIRCSQTQFAFSRTRDSCRSRSTRSTTGAAYSAATATGFSIGTPMRLPYSVHEPS